MEEKTGYAVDELFLVGEFQPANGLLKDKTKVFLAEIGSEIISQQDVKEDVEVLYRRPDEIDEMVAEE